MFFNTDSGFLFVSCCFPASSNIATQKKKAALFTHAQARLLICASRMHAAEREEAAFGGSAGGSSDVFSSRKGLSRELRLAPRAIVVIAGGVPLARRRKV
jgi:hypothetical protein